MHPDAVIFDFDGVIVDTEPIHYRAFQAILEPLGLGYSWDVYTETYMGFDDRDAFREAYRASGMVLSDAELGLLIDRKAHIFEDVINAGVTAYPGVIELVRALSDKGVPLAICSGALKRDILPILKQLDIGPYFAHIVTADDVAQSKPDPACYLLARQKLVASFPDKLTPAAIIYAIEDTPAGIQAAKAAGLQVVGVSNSYPQEQLHAADRVVASLEGLF
jgi:beta-phosphoglucomutase